MDREGLKVTALKPRRCVLHSVQAALPSFFPLILIPSKVQKQLELEFWNDFKIVSCLQHVFPPFREMQLNLQGLWVIHVCWGPPMFWGKAQLSELSNVGYELQKPLWDKGEQF